VRDLEWLLVLVEVDRPGRFHSDLLLSAGALTKGQRRKFVSSFILEPFGMKDRDAEVHQPSETKESTMKSKLSLILPLFVLLAPYVTGCSSGYYLMQLIEEHDGSDWVYLSDGCMLVVDDGSQTGSGSGSPDDADEDYFGVETYSTKGVAEVTISTASETIELEFDQEYLESGEQTVTEVTTDGGTRYRFTHWGSEDCEVRGEEEGMGGAEGEPAR
jgi:hypothetical protein